MSVSLGESVSGAGMAHLCPGCRVQARHQAPLLSLAWLQPSIEGAAKGILLWFKGDRGVCLLRTFQRLLLSFGNNSHVTDWNMSPQIHRMKLQPLVPQNVTLLGRRIVTDIISISVCLSLSHVWLYDAMNCVALQAPLSMGFSRQEYWSGLRCPSSGDYPVPGPNPGLLHFRYRLKGSPSQHKAILKWGAS